MNSLEGLSKRLAEAAGADRELDGAASLSMEAGMSDALYEALKRFGHSPAKAAEIALDAARGDKHALRWIAAIGAKPLPPPPTGTR